MEDYDWKTIEIENDGKPYKIDIRKMYGMESLRLRQRCKTPNGDIDDEKMSRETVIMCVRALPFSIERITIPALRDIANEISEYSMLTKKNEIVSSQPLNQDTQQKTKKSEDGSTSSN